ncbi:protein ABHD18-like isoform X3 [Dysidea avara]|uniref:protein ABHD18-like isoform X3 n=1 Tax=Dysidea avara TaxID=196820 RepID=UPI003316E209
MTDNIYHGLVTSNLAKFFSRGWGEVQSYKKLLKLRRKLQSRPHFLSLLNSIPTISCKLYYWRRRYLTATPLLREEQIGSILVENPYYGSRKPLSQTRSSLCYVSDLLVMGAALVLESYVLHDWLHSQGIGPVGITGMSMGGHNASLAGSVLPDATAVVPCFSWATAASVFTRGVLKDAVCWDVLQNELLHSKLGQSKIYQILQEEIITCDSLNTGFTDATSDFEQSSNHFGEAMRYMKIVLDYWTHLKYYSIPVDPTLTVFVTAKEDKYVPREWAEDVRQIWPGCSVQSVDGGHVTGMLLQQKRLRKILCQTMQDLSASLHN